MIIIGVYVHFEFQQIALVDTDSGECQEKRLAHREEARKGIGIRLMQADWLMTKFGDQTQDSQGSVSAGIVIKF